MQISIYSMSVTERWWKISISGVFNTIMYIWSLACSTVLRGMSELIHSFQAFNFLCPNPMLSWWPHFLFHKKVEASSGNSLSFLPPHQHGACMCSVCVLCALLIVFLHNQISQTDVCLCSPRSPNCYLVLDSLQSSFGPHCDTRTAFAEGRRDHLVGILWSSSYSCG